MTVPPEDARNATALPLIRRGWEQLRLQRPLAAWADWQRALRLEPGNEAADQALDRLAVAIDLPAVARLPLRLRPPRDEASRLRWDAVLRGRDLNELEAAAQAFGSLADADPADGEARFNQALCLAWDARNTPAIRALESLVGARAGADPELATTAWTLAELLRHGAGAEALSDDLDHVALVDEPGDLVDRLLGSTDLGVLVPVSSPIDPALAPDPSRDVRLFEWLDRPLPSAEDPPDRIDALPRLLATLMATPDRLRLASPDPDSLGEALERLGRLDPGRSRSADRIASPLPLALLDAAIWTFRHPADLPPERKAGLYRAAVERYYEQVWVGRPRQGLDGRNPVEAAALARSGDAVARVKLAALVRFREQLGERPRTLPLYQGYPFDRLRRRLGLELVDPAAVDDSDPSCLDAAGLDALDPAALDDARLLEAFESAAALGDDRRAARFAAALADREAPSLEGNATRPAFATLVRVALADDDPEAALDRIDRAIALDRRRNEGRLVREYRTWRAEVLARSDRPEEAVEVYADLLADYPRDAALALDAAETLLDNGYGPLASMLARRAREIARAAGDLATLERAEDWLDVRADEDGP